MIIWKCKGPEADETLYFIGCWSEYRNPIERLISKLFIFWSKKIFCRMYPKLKFKEEFKIHRTRRTLKKIPSLLGDGFQYSIPHRAYKAQIENIDEYSILKEIASDSIAALHLV